MHSFLSYQISSVAERVRGCDRISMFVGLSEILKRFVGLSRLTGQFFQISSVFKLFVGHRRYRNASNKRPGAYQFLEFEGGRLFEGGCLFEGGRLFQKSIFTRS